MATESRLLPTDIRPYSFNSLGTIQFDRLFFKLTKLETFIFKPTFQLNSFCKSNLIREIYRTQKSNIWLSVAALHC